VSRISEASAVVVHLLTLKIVEFLFIHMLISDDFSEIFTMKKHQTWQMFGTCSRKTSNLRYLRFWEFFTEFAVQISQHRKTPGRTERTDHAEETRFIR